MKRDKYLPVGSVIILKGAKKKLMITGFLPVDTSGSKPVAYDYSACLYPEGILTSNETFLVNHNEIDKIFYLGYESDEEIEFKIKLENELSKIKKEKATDVSFSEEINKNKNIFDSLRE